MSSPSIVYNPISGHMDYVSQPGGATVTTGTIKVGTNANLPGSSANAGDTYRTTDSPYVYIWTGSAWQAYYGPWPVTPPPTAGWTWDNQGTATLDTTFGYPYIWCPHTTGANLRLLYRTAPATPYKIRALIVRNASTPGLGASSQSFIGFRDATGLIWHVRMGSNTGQGSQTAVSTWTNSTTFVTNLIALSAAGANFGVLDSNAPMQWVQIEDDGANIKASTMVDMNYPVLLFSQARGTFFTGGPGPTQVCFGTYPVDTDVAVSILSWRVF